MLWYSKAQTIFVHEIIFLIGFRVDASTSYNVIQGRITINPNKIISYTMHQKIKFVTLNKIEKVLSDQSASERYYVNCDGT